MASKRVTVPAKHLFTGFRTYQPCRAMATEATITTTATTETPDPAPIRTQGPSITTSTSNPESITRTSLPTRPTNPFLKTAQCTLYTFPSLTPSGFTTYPSTHLLLPLRKDILHRAIIYEGDSTRQGTASTKTRYEVHGSNRKIRPQKGTGRARLGDKKSPMLRGGGVTFGPKPRDFSTDLPRKVYDLAWRTALSYRYAMGELMVIDGEMEIEGVEEGSLERYMRDLLAWNHLGREGGKTLFVTEEPRENLFTALSRLPKESRALEVEDVDVKDLLEGKRVAIERLALERILVERASDLAQHQQFRKRRELED